jgi:hypothetical protein
MQALLSLKRLKRLAHGRASISNARQPTSAAGPACRSWVAAYLGPAAEWEQASPASAARRMNVEYLS